MKAYVYKWTDHKTGMIYIGARKGDPLGDKYICSNKPMLEEYEKRSKDFTREIIFQGNPIEVSDLEWQLQWELFEKEIPCYNQQPVRYNYKFYTNNIFYCDEERWNIFSGSKLFSKRRKSLISK